MKYLILILTLFIFTASEFISGKSSAPSMRFLSFKEIRIVNGKDSRFREERGVSYERRQIFAHFYMSKFIRGFMPKFKTPSGELLDKLSILEIAVEVSMAKLQTQYPNNSLLIKGIDNAYADFKKELTEYINQSELWAINVSKLRVASKSVGCGYNEVLNQVIDCVNIIPRKDGVIC